MTPERKRGVGFILAAIGLLLPIVVCAGADQIAVKGAPDGMMHAIQSLMIVGTSLVVSVVLLVVAICIYVSSKK